MGYVLIGLFVYVAFGSVIAALTTGRSTVDIVLDILLWPVIVYYYFQARAR